MANVIEFTLKTTDKASAGIKKVTQSVLNMGKAVAKGALVVTGMTTAVVGWTTVIARAQDQAGKFSLRIGKSVEDLTKWQFAAGLAGIETNAFNMSVQRLERRVAQAAEGTGEAVNVLNKYGIEAQSFVKLGLDQQLSILSDKFADVGDNTVAMADAFKLFDTEGVAMLQLLSQGSEEAKKLTDRAAELGVVISAQAAANSAKFNDEMSMLWSSITGVSRSIANEFIPVLTGVVNGITNVISSNKTMIKDFAIGTAKSFLTVGFIAIDTFDNIVKAIKSTFSAKGFDNFVKGFQNAAVWILGAAGDLTLGFAKVWVTAFKVIWETFVTAGEWAWESIKAIFTDDKTISLGELLFKKIPEETAKALGDFKTAMGGYVSIATEKAGEAGSAINSIAQINIDSATAQADLLIEQLSLYAETLTNTQASTEAQTQGFLDRMTDMYQNHMETVGSLQHQVATEMSQVLLTTIDNVSNATADAIVEQKNLMKALAGVLKSTLKAIIAALIKVGIQRLLAATISKGANVTELSSSLAASSAETYGKVFATYASIPFVGPALGAAAGTAASASLLAGAGAAGAAGSATGAGIAGGAHGGLGYVPSEQTYLLNKGERVLSPNQNSDFTDFINGGGVGGGGIIIENMQIDILPNATSASTMLEMSDAEMREVVQEKIIGALDDLEEIGIRQKVLNQLV